MKFYLVYIFWFSLILFKMFIMTSLTVMKSKCRESISPLVGWQGSKGQNAHSTFHPTFEYCTRAYSPYIEPKLQVVKCSSFIVSFD